MTPTPTPANPVDDIVNGERNMNDTNNKEEVCKVWCDGCYDMVHFGHANNLRQAKALAPKVHLIVGVHSDAEIGTHKNCEPVFNEYERYTMIRAIKWVDQVVEAAPYITNISTLDEYDCKFCAHGNDITTDENGNDTYQAVKDGGRYREVERTHGVSTTDLIDRILKRGVITQRNDGGDSDEKKKTSPYSGKCQFLPTTRKLQLFSDPKEPSANDRIVYVDGTFDIFHPGHVEFLKKAKEEGDYIIIGLHTDDTVASIKGTPPVMNLHERVLSVLACRYVDEVVIGAPYLITEELLEHFNVSCVLHGISTNIVDDPVTKQDPYKIPRARGIFREIDSGSDLTTDTIIARVQSRRTEFEERNAKKEKKEIQLIESLKNQEQLQKICDIENHPED